VNTIATAAICSSDNELPFAFVRSASGPVDDIRPAAGYVSGKNFSTDDTLVGKRPPVPNTSLSRPNPAEKRPVRQRAADRIGNVGADADIDSHRHAT
jgi:hypothetical protein